MTKLEQYHAWAEAEYARRVAQGRPGYTASNISPKLTYADSVRRRLAAKEKKLAESQSE